MALSRPHRDTPAEGPEDAQKSYTTILDQEIEEGLEELERPAAGLFMSGLSAGLDIGFSVLMIALVVTRAKDVWSEPLFEIARANAYAVGFVLVIFGRSELFTEHTSLAVLPVLARTASLVQLARLWALVYASNLLGAAAFAALLVVIAPALEIVPASVFETMALELVEPRWWVLLLSGVLAGWLMGLVSWLVTAGRDTISEIFFVWLVTASIGFAHLHHCIVGSAEMLAGVFAGDAVTWSHFFYFLVLATVGNIIGGTVFVAVIKYGHATSIRRGMRHTLRAPPGK